MRTFKFLATLPFSGFRRGALRERLSLLAVSALLGLIPSPASATLITTASSFVGNQSSCSMQGSSFASCQIQGVQTLPSGTFPYSGSAQASASYGALSLAVQINSGPNFAGSIATAEFDDTLTIFGGSGIGFIQYILSGNASTGFGGCGNAGLCTVSLQDGTSTAEQVPVGVLSGQFSYTTQLYAFSFGVPFQLNASAALPIAALSETGSKSLSVNLSQLQIYNSQLQPIQASVSAFSGTIYPTPEPASILLLLSAVIGIGIKRAVS